MTARGDVQKFCYLCIKQRALNINFLKVSTDIACTILMQIYG